MKRAQGNWPYIPSAAVREALMPVMVLSWLGLGVSAQFSAGAAPDEPAVASSLVSYAFDLNYQEIDQARVLETIHVKLQISAFRKEPPLANRGVFRGLLLWVYRAEFSRAPGNHGTGKIPVSTEEIGNRRQKTTSEPRISL